MTAVTDVAKERGGQVDQPVTLSTGVRAYVRPVAASLIDEVTARIRDPDVPTWHNPDKDRDEPNPNDPAYLRGLEDANRQRGIAAIDALVMFGVDLVDGLPEDDSWLAKLRYLEKRGHLDLSSYDMDDQTDLEFLFKRFVAVASPDIALISMRSGVQGEAVAQAARSFRGDDTRAAD